MPLAHGTYFMEVPTWNISTKVRTLGIVFPVIRFSRRKQVHLKSLSVMFYRTEESQYYVLTSNWKLHNSLVAVTIHVYNVCCCTHIKACIYTFSPLNRIITLTDAMVAFIKRLVFKSPFHPHIMYEQVP
jgi:hypothetical protein